LKRVLVSVTNDLSTDQRVHRVCTTLTNSNFKVLLVGRKLQNSLPLNRLYKTKRMSLLFNKGFLFYTEYNVRLFFYLLFNKKDILLANDADTLIPNYLVSKLQNKPLIFDSHELFSEVPELFFRPRVKSIWLKIENTVIPRIKIGYTVSDSIALYYKNLYNVTFEVIRNVPLQTKNNTPVASIKLNNNAILYQGAINTGRGLELMIKAMQFVDNGTFYIIGEGMLLNKLKQKVSKLNLTEKVIFLGTIDPSELKSITIQAAVGISLEEDLGLNYRYALPNKLFDYIQAEIPVLVSNLPEMAQLVKQYNVGEVITNRAPNRIANMVEYMFLNKNIYKKHLKKAALELCWEQEELKFKKLIHKII